MKKFKYILAAAVAAVALVSCSKDDKKEEKPVKSDELKTLEEIRDLLKKKNK